MSPALLDAGVQSPHLGSRFLLQAPSLSTGGQVSNPFCSSGVFSNDQGGSSHAMNPSNPDGVGPSGFRGTSSTIPNFEFSSRSIGNPDSDRVFGTARGLSRPRVAKVKKSLHCRSMGSSETSKFDLGLNPFRPVSGDGKNVSSVGYDLGSSHSIKYRLNVPDNLASSPIRNNHYFGPNLCSVENPGDELVDVIRDLKLECHKKEDDRRTCSEKGSGTDEGTSSKLAEEIKKLNIEATRTREASRSSAGKYVKLSGGAAYVTELPDNLKNLNLQDTVNPDANAFVRSPVNNYCAFGNGNKNGDSIDPAMADMVASKMKNLSVRSNFDRVDVNDSSVHAAIAPDNMILDGLQNLRIGRDSTRSDDQGGEYLHSATGEKKSLPGEVSSECREHRGDSTVAGGPNHQSNNETYASSTAFQTGNYGTREKCLFGFTGKQDTPAMPYVEFKTPRQEVLSFTFANQKMEFGAKREQDQCSIRRKPKLKGSSSVQLHPAEDFSREKESSLHKKPEPSESYSPMDTSPYQELVDDNDTASTASFPVKVSFRSDDSKSTYKLQATDMKQKDLFTASGQYESGSGNSLKVDEAETHNSYSYYNKNSGGGEPLSRRSVLMVDTESFKTADENFGMNEQTEDVNSPFSDECESRASKTEFFSACGSGMSEGVSFTFAASSSSKGQGSLPAGLYKKKSRTKVSKEPFCNYKESLLSDASSAVHISSISGGSSLHSTVLKQKEDVSIPQRKGRLNLQMRNVNHTKPEPSSSRAVALSAKEACEKWRLRGNQAYSKGELDSAEEYYTQGVNCISSNGASREGLRALMLCYSNRAAIRMGLGRYKDGLQDCLAATEIDPTFCRVRVRTANCYLALGEVTNASQHFMLLLRSGSDACVDRKIIVEASDGLQKAQKVSEYMDHAATLLQNRSLFDAEGALQTIAEALVISPCSEKLLKMKADALFMMQRYEGVIKHCEQTLETVRKNFPEFDAECDSSELTPSDLQEKHHFCIWCFSLILKSYFFLGKLEEGLNALEKQVDGQKIADKYGKKAIESAVPLLGTMRELLQHKCAGNEAYQAGKHVEAIEHYTAALGRSIESRRFAAICFGNRAAAYQAIGKISDAIADCNLAVALDGNYLKAISRRATLFEMIRDYDQAACDLQKMVSLLTKQVEENAGRNDHLQSDLREAHMRLAHVEDHANKRMPLDFYLILAVEQSATSAIIKKAYRKAALKHHPDKAAQFLSRSENGDDVLWKETAEDVEKNADKLFKIIGEAYSVLSDPTKRFRYEEDVRNALAKSGGGNPMGMRSDRRSGGVDRGRWRDLQQYYGNPSNQGFDPTNRSSRFY